MKGFVYRIWLKILKFYYILKLQQLNSIDSSAIEKIILVVNGGVGDFIMLWPLISRISEKYELLIFIRRPVVRKFISDMNLNLSLVTDKTLHNLPNLVFLYSYGYEDGNLDLLKNFKFSTHLGYVLDNSMINLKGRYEKVTQPIIYSNHVQNNLNLLNLIGIQSSFNLKDLQIKRISEPSNEEIKIVLNLKTKGYSRNWPICRYIELLDNLNKHLTFKTILVGGPEDFDLASEFYHKCCDRLKIDNMVGKLNFHETAKIIAESKFFITGDSGLLHISGSFTNTRTIALFGPTNPVNYSWLYPNVTSISYNNSPCNFGPKKITCKCPKMHSCNHLYNINSDMIASDILNAFNL